MNSWLVKGGEIVSSDNVQQADLITGGDMIEAIEAQAEPALKQERIYDARDCLVLPGIIDIHGDAFERIVQPRPGLMFPMDVALKEADRQMMTNGITTAYHGLAISWEPGLRSMQTARDFMSTLTSLGSDLAVDTKVNMRWETFAFDYCDEVIGWLKTDPAHILSFNDHTTTNLGHKIQSSKIGRLADRCGLTREDAVAMLHEVWERREEVPAAIDRMASEGRALGTKMFAHDEDAIEVRRQNRQMGISVSEFPMTEDTADEARDHGEAIILGSPNVLRGGSQNNALDATTAIKQGRCTCLASDYYYPAMMFAAFKLVDEQAMSLPEAWKLISLNAAKAAGLDDRGALEVGKRADILVVDKSSRRIKAVFVAGQKVLEHE